MPSIYPASSSRRSRDSITPSSTSKSPHSSSIINQQTTDLDHPCHVYWDDHPDRGSSMDHFGLKSPPSNHHSSIILIHPNSLQSIDHSSLPTTPPSKRSSIHSSAIKRNSTLAGISSPSKPPCDRDRSSLNPIPDTIPSSRVNLAHPNRRPLREAKRRRDRSRRSSDLNPIRQLPTTPPKPNSTTIGRLLSTKTAALNALAIRASLRRQRDSDGSNHLITSPSKPSPKKGKTPIHRLEARAHQLPISRSSTLINSPNLKNTISKPSVGSSAELLSSPSSKSKHPQPPTHSPDHPLTDSHLRLDTHSLARPLINHKPTNHGLPRCITPRPQPHDPRKESQSKEPLKPLASTPILQVHPEPPEPWEIEEDEEFGSQLLELVDLVEREQRISQESLKPLPDPHQVGPEPITASHSNLITSVSSKSTCQALSTSKSKTGISDSTPVSGEPRRKKEFPVTRTRSNDPSRPVTNNYLNHSDSKPKPNSDSSVAPKPISIVSKATLISKRNVPNSSFKLDSLKTVDHPSRQCDPIGTESGIVRRKKSVDPPIRQIKPNVLIETTAHMNRGCLPPGSHQLRPTAKSDHRLGQEQRSGISHPKVVTGNRPSSDQIAQVINTPDPKRIDSDPGDRPRPAPSRFPDYDLNLLFNGLIGDDLDWDPNE